MSDMAGEFLTMRMEISMKEIGKKIKSMEKVSILGKMAAVMMEIT